MSHWDETILHSDEIEQIERGAGWYRAIADGMKESIDRIDLCLERLNAAKRIVLSPENYVDTIHAVMDSLDSLPENQDGLDEIRDTGILLEHVMRWENEMSPDTKRKTEEFLRKVRGFVLGIQNQAEHSAEMRLSVGLD